MKRGMQKLPISYLFVLATLSATGLSGCNIFDPLDSPSGDEQLLSAARACFDQGDYQCALDHYAKLSTDQAETVAAETAFVMLDRAGAGMSSFTQVVGNGKTDGKALSKFATLLTPSAGEAKRLEIYRAYQKVALIQNNVQLRGLVRFVTGIALAAELLAEDAGGDGTYQNTDLVTSATVDSCRVAACPGSCTKAASSSFNTGSVVDITGNNPPAESSMSGALTWGKFYGAVQAVDQGLTTELATSGKFQNISSTFNVITTAGSALANASDLCFRALLLETGVGKND